MEIAILRKEVLKARRNFQRNRSRLGEKDSREFLEQWKSSRKALAVAIKSAKEKMWAELIATVNDDLWSKPYRIFMKKLKRAMPIPSIELPG